MIRLIFFIFIGLSTGILFAQTGRELKPELGRIPDLNPAHQKAIDRRDLLMGKESPTEAEQQEMEKLLSIYGETVESIWDVEDGGCSWYCGDGRPYKIISSSALAPQNDITYDGRNAHDLSFRNAWVEGVQGYGVGEYLEYYFKNDAPRITEIKIFNGYVKTDKAWQENSRVKKLRLTVNGEQYAMLNLADTKAEQIFKIQPLGRRSDGKDLILRFMVEDVYKGTKYDDTCITEIYFDGLDVHCFAKGTKVTLHNGRLKNIEHLAEGDTVLGFDQLTGTFKASIIEKLEMAYHKDLVKYIFDDGSTVIATQDHPFLLDLKRWSSLKPDRSKHYSGFENVGQIEEGDRFMTRNADGKTEVRLFRRIEIIQQEQETFTISKLNGANCFIANGFIVGVEALQLIHKISFSKKQKCKANP